MLAVRRGSVRSVWQRIVNEGGIVSYETFLRWVRDLESELVEEGILRVGKGRRKKRYVVRDEDALIKKLEERGYVF